MRLAVLAVEFSEQLTDEGSARLRAMNHEDILRPPDTSATSAAVSFEPDNSDAAHRLRNAL
jgi:hypothetical protein